MFRIFYICKCCQIGVGTKILRLSQLAWLSFHDLSEISLL